MFNDLFLQLLQNSFWILLPFFFRLLLQTRQDRWTLIIRAIRTNNLVSLPTRFVVDSKIKAVSFSGLSAYAWETSNIFFLFVQPLDPFSCIQVFFCSVVLVWTKSNAESSLVNSSGKTEVDLHEESSVPMKKNELQFLVCIWSTHSCVYFYMH